jgi:propionyl-CoA synthetase
VGGSTRDGKSHLRAASPSPPPTASLRSVPSHSTLTTHIVSFAQTGDAGLYDDDGYLHIMARADDVLNVAGHRLSTGSLEAAIAGHDAIAECAVIGPSDGLKGQVPLGLLVLKAGVTLPHDQVIAQVIQRVRDVVGPVAAFRQAVIVNRLPKTRSGKVLRATMKSIADGEAYRFPATIDEPATLSEVEAALRRIGYARPSVLTPPAQ